MSDQPSAQVFRETYQGIYKKLKEFGETVWINFDQSQICPEDGTVMRLETSHYRCLLCGFILPCCEGGPV